MTGGGDATDDATGGGGGGSGTPAALGGGGGGSGAPTASGGGGGGRGLGTGGATLCSSPDADGSFSKTLSSVIGGFRQ
jgi:hypothetical protein